MGNYFKSILMGRYILPWMLWLSNDKLIKSEVYINEYSKNVVRIGRGGAILVKIIPYLGRNIFSGPRPLLEFSALDLRSRAEYSAGTSFLKKIFSRPRVVLYILLQFEGMVGYYERGRRPSEFSLNMRIFSSWATDRPTDRPTVTLFSVLYLLNQATDWQTIFGI